jgi:membrane protein
MLKVDRNSKNWETVLGVAELATVVFYAWENAKRVSPFNKNEAASRLNNGIEPASDQTTGHPSLSLSDDGTKAAQGLTTTDHQNSSAHLPTDHEVSPGNAVTTIVKGQGFSLKEIGQLALDAAKSWSTHRAASKGAALSLYTLFSLAPMLVLVIAVAGLFFGADAVRELLVKQLSGVLGAQGADAVKTMLAGAHFESDSVMAAMVSTGLLLVGATSAFSELKASLDELWGVPKDVESGIWALVKERFLSFGLVLVLALMMLISLTVSTALTAIGDVVVGGMVGTVFILVAKVLSALVSFLIVTALFAAIYKYLPAVPISWRDIILGSLLTSILFLLGKFLIGMYLQTTNFSSGYGAAGSLVLLVSWIYYSAQIFFYGAIFTHEHAVRRAKISSSPSAKA